MAINPNNGVLDIINGTLKVSSIDIKQTAGFTTAINTVARNDVLLADDQKSTTTFTPTALNGYMSSTGVTRDTSSNYLELGTASDGGWVYWPLQLPNSWHTEFDMHVTATGGVLTYSLFNTSEPNHTDYTNNDGGYKIVFDNTNNQIVIYWEGSIHKTVSATLRSNDWQHVNINYFQGAVSISLAGKVVLTHEFTENYQEFDSRYVGFSATAGTSHKIRHLIVHNSDKWLYTKTSNASDIAYVSGNVGIGSLTPTELLDVHGNVHIAKDLTVDGNLTVSGTTTFIDSTNLAVEDPIIELARGNTSDTIDAGLIVTRNTSNVAVAYRGDEEELALGYTQSGASDTDVTPIADGGLDVRVYGNLFANNLTTTANVEATYVKGDGSELTQITLDQVVGYANTTGNTVQFTNTDVGLVATGNVEANYFVGDGSELTNISTTLQAISDNGNVTSNTIQFTNATTAFVADSNVGIGTDAPTANLHVMGYQYVNDPPTIANSFDHSDAPLTLTHGTVTSADPKPILHLTREGTSGQAYGARASFNLSRYENSGTASRSRLDLALADGTYAESTVMTLRADGNVGVGTTSPGYNLDVHGSANVGALTATTISGPLSGNASTATALQTARTIGGVSFDGTANINLPGVNTTGNQNTSGNAATATTLQTARNINGVSFNGSADITVNGLNYNVNNGWLKEQGDNANFKQYGNSRQMVFRTDGTTEYASGVGGYPFAWMYGGDAASNRRMLLNTSGQLWCSNYGWLHDKFAYKDGSNSPSGTWAISITGNAGTATQVNNSLTPGSYLTGSAFNGSAARTFAVDATTGNVGNKVVARDASGHINFTYGFSSYLNMSHGVSGATTDTIFYSSYDNYIRKNNATGFRASLNVPTRTGGNASGTWAISITGNAATATTAGACSGSAAQLGGVTLNNIFNNTGGAHSNRTDFDAVPDAGCYYITGATNGPGVNGANQYYGFTLGLGSNYAPVNDGAIGRYGTQIYWGRNVTNPYINIRYLENGTWQSWQKAAAGYADSAGNADTVDSLHASSFFRGDTSNGVNVRFTAGDGTGVRFWDSDSYKIWMSNATNGTWGGRLSSNSDYNMYFKMTGGTNRGFCFMNSSTVRAHITGGGDMYLNGGWFRTYNSTGWYNETHGGGWYMTDSTWVRTYNSKSVYVTGEIHAHQGDSGNAILSAYGDSQGTGRLYVGQSSTYGGGIEYNGDNSPGTTGAGADYIALYRVENGTYNWTARNLYNSNNWEFRGTVTAPTFSGTATVANSTNGNGKIVVQNGTNGGNSRGIWMWTSTDSNWGIYMGQSGSGRSLSGGTANYFDTVTSHCIRFRVNNNSANGFIFENSSENMWLGLRASDGYMVHYGPMYNSGTLESDGRIYADNGLHVRGDWLRVNGTNGLYFESYGGGWYMQDSTWVRVYNGKSLWCGNGIMGTNYRCGVGTSNPLVPLHVYGTGASVNSGSFRYMSYSGTGSGTGTWGALCASFEGGHVRSTDSFLAHTGSLNSSDERIKKEISDIDDASALETLRLIQPKTYKYKDEEKMGSDVVYGFIAQQIQEVLPYATKTLTDYLPSIREMSNVTQSNVITFTNFNTNDLLSNTTIIQAHLFKGENRDLTISEIIDEHSIRVEEDLTEMLHENDTRLYIYGEQVDDFVFLKKESIFTIATAALQEVDRQLQAEKAKVATLETQLASVLARLDALENPPS